MKPDDVPCTCQPSGQRQRKVSDWWSDQARSTDAAPRNVDWLESVTVQAVLNVRATGSEDLNWLQRVKRHLPDPGLELGLSIGCGTGALERDALTQGLCRRMEAVDIAPGAIEIARREAAGLPVSYSVMDLQKDDLEPGRYDIAFCANTLHHINELHHCLEQVHSALKDGGLLVLHEFVGPCRFQWTGAQLARVGDVYSFLPLRYRFNSFAGGTIASPLRPGLAEMVEGDPSEAVRSSEMLDVVELYFERVERVNLGGTVLNPLLSGIIANFDEDDRLDAAFIGLAALLEDIWVSGGVVPSDFVIDIYARRPEVDVGSSVRREQVRRSNTIAEQESVIAELQGLRRQMTERYGELESDLVKVRGALQAESVRAQRLQQEIDELRAGAKRHGRRGRQQVHPGAEAGCVALRPAGAVELDSGASSQARAALSSARERVPAWVAWTREVFGPAAARTVAEKGAATVEAPWGGACELRLLAGGAGGSGLLASINARLPVGWRIEPAPEAVRAAASRAHGGRQTLRRRFYAGEIVRPAGSSSPMDDCLAALVSYVTSEAAEAEELGPWIEVSAACEVPPPVRAKAADVPVDIVRRQDEEISWLTGEMAERQKHCEELEGWVTSITEELARAKAAVDGMDSVRKALEMPWPLRPIRLKVLERRQAGG